jgi:hypothetical protein
VPGQPFQAISRRIHNSTGTPIISHLSSISAPCPAHVVLTRCPHPGVHANDNLRAFPRRSIKPAAKFQNGTPHPQTRLARSTFDISPAIVGLYTVQIHADLAVEFDAVAHAGPHSKIDSGYCTGELSAAAYLEICTVVEINYMSNAAWLQVLDTLSVAQPLISTRPKDNNAHAGTGVCNSATEYAHSSTV